MLGAEFESISLLLSSKCDEMSLHEVQFSLQTHELRLQNQAAASNIANLVFQPQANVAYQQNYGNNYGNNRGRDRSVRGLGNRGKVR